VALKRSLISQAIAALALCDLTHAWSLDPKPSNGSFDAAARCRGRRSLAIELREETLEPIERLAQVLARCRIAQPDVLLSTEVVAAD
jgi:hypothetical protein